MLDLLARTVSYESMTPHLEYPNFHLLCHEVSSEVERTTTDAIL